MPYRLLKKVLDQTEKVNKETIEKVIWLAIEIAREGREGRKVGTLFVISDSEEVLRHSKPLILDPLFGHPDEAKHLDDPNMRETIKELALLDGGFVVSDDGVCLSACRYIEASVEGIEAAARAWEPPPCGCLDHDEDGVRRGGCVGELDCARFLQGQDRVADNTGGVAAEQAHPAIQEQAREKRGRRYIRFTIGTERAKKLNHCFVRRRLCILLSTKAQIGKGRRHL